MFIDVDGREKVIVDITFPPNLDALLGKGGAITKFKAWEDYMWMSPNAFYSGSPYIVSVSVTPTRINSNFVPTSPMLAAMAAFALKPARLAGMITQPKGDGIFYEVKLCYDGEITPIKIDYYFPHDSIAKKYVFAYSEVREIWPMLIEKACAKCYGSYQHVTLRLQKEPLNAAFRLLTGYPTEIVKHDNKENLLNKIQNGLAKEYPIISTTGTIQCTVMEIIKVMENLIMKTKVKVIMWDKEYLALHKEFVCIEEDYTFTNTYLILFDDFFENFVATGINKLEPEVKFIKAMNFVAPEVVESSLKSPTVSASDATLVQGLMNEGELHLFEIRAKENYRGFVKVLEKGLRDSETRYGVLVGFKEEESKEIEYVTHRLYLMEKMVTIEMEGKKNGCYYCLVKTEKEPDKESKLKIALQDNSELKNLREITNRDMIEYTLVTMIKGYIKAKATQVEVSKGIYEYTFKNCLNILTGKYFVNEADYQLYATIEVKNGAVGCVPPASSNKLIVKVDPGDHKFLCLLWKKTMSDPEIRWKNLLNKSKETLIKEIEERKLKPASKEELAPGVFFLTYKHDCGILFAIQNTTKHMLYKGSHKFAFDNLSLKEEDNDTGELEIMVTPDTTYYLNAKTLDIYKPVNYSFKHTSTMETATDMDQRILDELMLTGKETRLEEKCYAWTKIISDHWCMYLANDSNFTAKISIQVVKAINLKCDDGENWQYILKSRAGYLKRVQSVNPLNVSSCIWKFICKLT